MKWIKRMLGITELIALQRRTNVLLRGVIDLQVQSIENDRRQHSEKKEVGGWVYDQVVKRQCEAEERGL